MKVAILSPYPTFALDRDLECTQRSYQNNATWTVTLADALARLPDLDVHVVTETEDIAASKQLRHGNVTLHFLRAPRQFKTLTFWQFDRLRLHRALDEIRPDIVHGQGIETQYGYTAVTSRYPFVITIHGISKLSNQVLDVPWFSRVKLVERFESYCLQKTRNIIIINPFIAEFLHLTEPRYRLFSIPNAVGQEYFARSPAKREDNLVLAIGYVDRLKAHDVLVHALALLQKQNVGCRAMIVGPQVDPKHLSTLHEFVRVHKLDVEFTGFMPPDQILPLLQRCTLLVHPSRHDNSPMVVCEAMAAGTPVIASRVGGIPNIVQDNDTGLLFESENVEELAGKLKLLFENEAMRQRLGARAREFAEKNYHPQRVAALTRAAYQEILAET